MTGGGRLTPIQSGMVLMTLAMALVPVGDALSKLLTDRYNPAEIAFWRFVFQTFALGAVAAFMRESLFRGHFGLLLLGGVSSGLVLVSLIGAFVVMPIATAIAIFFVEPLILTVLSAVILREATGWRRYGAVTVGLLGAIIILRPSWSAFGWRALLPVVAALAFACNAIVIRKVSAHMPSIVIQFWFALFAALGLGLVLAVSGGFALVGPWGVDKSGPWGQLVAMGALSALTFFLISEGFRRTPAGTLAPFQYLEIVGATILGLVVFGELPDFWTWVGTAIILASGLYVFHRERRLGAAPVRESR